MSVEHIPPQGVYNTRGGLSVYGPGTDGDVTIIGTVSLSRDMYYNNLTILANAQLDTNGYRVFVKDTLNMSDPTAVIGRLADTDKVGTILGGASSGLKASDTLGGDGGLNPGENFFGEAEFYNFSQAIAGYKFDAISGTLRFLMGGSGGLAGESGSAGQSGSYYTLGESGTSGSAGFPGTRPGFENTIGASGGQGYPGSPGSPGSPGVVGSGGSGGAGGAGGAGGGVVIISARNVHGSGVIRADGLAGSPPIPGSPGNPGSPGAPGAPGSPGAPAPDFFSSSYTYTVTYAYNYNVAYNFAGTPVPAANYSTYYYYNTYAFANYNTVAVGFWYYFYSPASYNNYLAAYYTYSPYYYANARNPFTTPGTARTSPGPARTSPGTPGPASVRWRSPTTTWGPPVTTYNAPTSGWNASTNSQAYNLVFKPATYGTFYYYNQDGPTPVITSYYYQFGNIAYNFGNTPITSYNTYNFFYVPIGTAYNVVPVAATYDIEPSVYHAGGAGGAGGMGGAGGVASSGLPGSPGTAGYVGGGGVVLLITEDDIPETIEARAAAGIGNNGGATSGTVLIIKNEAVKDGN